MTARRVQSTTAAGLEARDAETRRRVLDAATRLFAERGLKEVTVRQICEAAHANVAAVNYHYGDKVGLYREVVRRATETMQETTKLAEAAGAGLAPEGRLRAYVQVFVRRVAASRDAAWIHRLMLRELADPTEVLDSIVAEVIRPRLAYLGEIVAAILNRPEEDPLVRRSVLCIQAQCHSVVRNCISDRLVPDLADAAAVDALAEHIADFSLGGLRALQPASQRPR